MVEAAQVDRAVVEGERAASGDSDAMPPTLDIMGYIVGLGTQPTSSAVVANPLEGLMKSRRVDRTPAVLSFEALQRLLREHDDGDPGSTACQYGPHCMFGYIAPGKCGRAMRHVRGVDLPQEAQAPQCMACYLHAVTNTLQVYMLTAAELGVADPRPSLTMDGKFCSANAGHNNMVLGLPLFVRAAWKYDAERRCLQWRQPHFP